MKPPSRYQSTYGGGTSSSIPAEKIPAQVLGELTGAGFLEVSPASGRKAGDRVSLVADATEFFSRIRALTRYHLLDPVGPSMLGTYVNACFTTSDLLRILQDKLSKAGIDDFCRIDEFLPRYVVSRRWPDWIAGNLDDPLAGRILGVVREAARPILLSELPGLLKVETPDRVRASLEKLISHLVLFEDLDPRSLDLTVGLLPDVRKALALAETPRQRPPLVICEAPRELGPDESILVGDLRAFLLEVASEPPRLRQDGALFQKEIERFEDVLEPVAPWMADLFKLTPEGRLERAFQWAEYLKLVKEVAEGKRVELHLVPKGQKWLTSSIDDQHAALIEAFRAPTTHSDHYSRNSAVLFAGVPASDYYSASDLRFFGVDIVSLRGSKGKRQPYLYESKPKDFQALREALDRVFTPLPPGTFVRLDSLEENAAFGQHNPVLLGANPDREQVSVYSLGRLVPPLEERLEEVGRQLIGQFVRNRLIPLGCVRAAIDDEGRLCIAREPLLDAYFGRTPASGASARQAKAAAPVASKVVVQPDFSIVVIGPSAAPVAELIPFCERTTRGSGRGAIVLKITRDAVIKAVSHGLKPAEIVARLQRHATHEIPANVLREVQGWADWVRRVSPETLTVLRCPDRETADRVMAALRKQAERIQDNLVAIAPGKLSTSDRQKLQDQGIILGKHVAPETSGSTRPKKKTRIKSGDRYY